MAGVGPALVLSGAPVVAPRISIVIVTEAHYQALCLLLVIALPFYPVRMKGGLWDFLVVAILWIASLAALLSSIWQYGVLFT